MTETHASFVFILVQCRSLSDFKGISTDFFQPSVRTAATFSTNMVLSISSDLIGEAANYVPALTGKIGAVLFKEITSEKGTTTAGVPLTTTAPVSTTAPESGTNRRRLLRASRDLAMLGKLTSADHPARVLMESIRSLGYSGILSDGSDFSEFCEIPADDHTAGCLVVKDLAVDTQQLVDVFTPVFEIFVTEDDDGALDNLAQPLLPLNDPIPGLSDLTGKDMTILDAGQAYPKAAKGVAAVRTFLSTYESIKSFVSNFAANDGVITIADECDVLDGFTCTGALFPDADDGEETVERKLEVVPEAKLIFGTATEAGHPLTPADPAIRRKLAACLTRNDFKAENDCAGVCSSADCSTSQLAKCRAAKVSCKANNIDGLSFPFLEDPMIMVGLISGEDFVSYWH